MSKRMGALLALLGSALVQAATWTVCPEDCQYTSIPEALERAAPGDVVVIGAGTYPGDLWIKRSVSLVGEGRDLVVVQGDVFVLATNQVALSGVTIRGHLRIEDSLGVVISDCASEGVVIRSSSATLRSTQVLGSKGHGILVTLSSRVLIAETTVEGCGGDGINVAASFVDVRSAALRNNQGWGIWADPFSTVGGDIAPAALEANALGGLGGRAVVLDRVPPGAPTGVTVEPADWSGGPFTVRWTVPPDLSGVAAAWYKIGAPPTGMEDGTRSPNPSLIVVSSPPEGRQTIHIWLEDKAGNKSELNRVQAFILCDRTPPSGRLSLSPSPFVATTEVTLVVQAEDRAGTEAGSGVGALRLSNDGKTWTAWEPFKTSIAWDLTRAGGSATPGEKTVYLQLRDRAGNVTELSTSLTLAQAFVQPEGVLSMALSRDGRLALGLSTGAIRLVDLATGREVRTFKGHTAGVWGVAFSPDGKLIASGAQDNTVRIWDVAGGKELRTLRGHLGGVWAVAFSPDGKLVASGSSDGSVKLWNPATGREVRSLTEHAGPVRALAFSPDGKILASGSDDKTVRVWDTATGSVRKTLSGHAGSVRALGFSPDGKLIASGSCGKFDRDRCVQNELKLWDAATGREVRTISSPGEGVRSLAFSPDGKILASGSAEGRVELWDVTSGKLDRALGGHTFQVTAVLFFPDGKTLLSGGEDRAVLLWKLAFPGG